MVLNAAQSQHNTNVYLAYCQAPELTIGHVMVNGPSTFMLTRPDDLVNNVVHWRRDSMAMSVLQSRPGRFQPIICLVTQHRGILPSYNWLGRCYLWSQQLAALDLLLLQSASYPVTGRPAHTICLVITDQCNVLKTEIVDEVYENQQLFFTKALMIYVLYDLEKVQQQEDKQYLPKITHPNHIWASLLESKHLVDVLLYLQWIKCFDALSLQYRRLKVQSLLLVSISLFLSLPLSLFLSLSFSH